VSASQAFEAEIAARTMHCGRRKDSIPEVGPSGDKLSTVESKPSGHAWCGKRDGLQRVWSRQVRARATCRRCESVRALPGDPAGASGAFREAEHGPRRPQRPNVSGTGCFRSRVNTVRRLTQSAPAPGWPCSAMVNFCEQRCEQPGRVVFTAPMISFTGILISVNELR
jgi:hypothetical protein